MDKIERDVYICQNTIVEPIDYPQGSNAVPIIFHMRDFSIPEEAYYTTVYFRKPSGHEIYDCGEIDQDENDLTFNVSEQMTCESGVMMMAVSIVDKEELVCNSFNVPFVVQPTSLAEDSGITSCDEYTALQELIQQALSYYETLQDIEAHIKDLYIEIDKVNEYLEELREKYDNDLQQMLNDLQKDFNDWFQNIKNVLDDDTAGHLQLEIEDAQEAASNALAQLATGYAWGYVSTGYDYAGAIVFGEGDDQYYVTIPRKICGCSGNGSGTDDGDVSVTQSEIDTAVNKYLEDHPVNYPVDDTLTQEGEAADAKTTGDRLNSVETALGNSVQSVDVGTTETGEPGTEASVNNAGTDKAVVLDFTIPRGDQGEQGPEGEKGETGEQGPAGADGKDGEDGFSPTVEVSKSGKVTTIRITDINGEHTAEINDGQDGSSSGEGGSGADGYSPTVSISKNDGVTTIVITDVNGDHTATINDGEQGPQGEQGPEGPQGPQGEKGDTGATGAAGKDGADGYTPVKGTDYFTQADIDEIVAEAVKQVKEQITTIEVDDPMTYIIGF